MMKNKNGRNNTRKGSSGKFIGYNLNEVIQNVLIHQKTSTDILYWIYCGNTCLRLLIDNVLFFWIQYVH